MMQMQMVMEPHGDEMTIEKLVYQAYCCQETLDDHMAAMERDWEGVDVATLDELDATAYQEFLVCRSLYAKELEEQVR